MKNRFRNYNAYLREAFGENVHKVTVDAGFTCPNRDGRKGSGGCIYCNNASFNRDQRQEAVSIGEQVRLGMARLRAGHGVQKFIAYFQAYTNTYAPVSELERRYREALVDPSVVGIAIGTRPDCLPDDVLELLQTLSEQTYLSLEIGLQSSNDKTLERIHRGHDSVCFADAVVRARSKGLEVCAHVIVGLPGEGRDEILRTARFLSAMDIQGVKIHALSVCRNTPLANSYETDEIHLLTQEEYVGLVCDFLEFLRDDILVHRMTTQVPPDLLVAPGWISCKQRVLGNIKGELAKRNSFQGALWRAGSVP